MADLTCKNLARLNKVVPVSGFLEEDLETDRYMTGRFLIAMPGMMDDRFQRTVIYMCAHARTYKSPYVESDHPSYPASRLKIARSYIDQFPSLLLKTLTQVLPC